MTIVVTPELRGQPHPIDVTTSSSPHYLDFLSRDPDSVQPGRTPKNCRTRQHRPAQRVGGLRRLTVRVSFFRRPEFYQQGLRLPLLQGAPPAADLRRDHLGMARIIARRAGGRDAPRRVRQQLFCFPRPPPTRDVSTLRVQAPADAVHALDRPTPCRARRATRSSQTCGRQPHAREVAASSSRAARCTLQISTARSRHAVFRTYAAPLTAPSRTG